MPRKEKTKSLAEIRRDTGGGLKEIGESAGLARTVLYRMLEGSGITLRSGVKLTKAYPNVHFRVGRKRYVIREV